MEIKNLLNRFLYLIFGIVFILVVFFIPVFYYYNESGGGTTRIFSLLIYWWNISGSGGVGPVTSYDNCPPEMFSFCMLVIIIGVVLLITTSILYNKEKIRNILPPIGITLMLIGLIMFSNYWWGPLVDEYSGVLPFYYQEGVSKIAFLSIGYYLGIALAGTCAVKYFFFNNAE